MAWTYANYAESEPDWATALSRARAFKAEIMGAQSATVSHGSASRDPSNLTALLAIVNADIERYERYAAATAATTRTGYARLTGSI